MNLLGGSLKKEVKSKNLVSCLCVSHNSYALLKRAIDCFLAQTYEDKELVIVYHRNIHITEAIIQLYANENIIFYEEDPNQSKTLGELRNKSIDICSGYYLCIWDDDDWYHQRRLEMQVEALKKNRKPGCLLTNLLIFDVEKCEAYYSQPRAWEGTLLCKKEILVKKLRYVSVDIDEDSPLLHDLLSHNLIFPLVVPTLYIYVFHGANTWAREHFEFNMRKSQKLSPVFSSMVNDILSGNISIEQGSEKLLSRDYLGEITYIVPPRPMLFAFHLKSSIIPVKN